MTDVPLPDLPDLPDLEAVMDAAWPAPDREQSGGWIFRAADGVTQRANSIWPRSRPAGSAREHLSLLREARAWYRSRRLPVIFQVFEHARSAALNDFLDAEGFTRQSETLILVRSARPEPSGPDPAADIEFSDWPTDEWLGLWWGVDGRGGDSERTVAAGILSGCPAVYALVRDDDGVPAAVGRLALAGGAGGIYCMATRPDRRRRGYASAVLAALLAEGNSLGLGSYWLLVTAANRAAQELYAREGFSAAGRYFYRQERPQRAPTGC